MNYVTVRDCIFGKGTPKICVPVMPKSYDTIKSEIDTLKGLAAANDAVIKAQVDDAVAQAMEKYGL